MVPWAPALAVFGLTAVGAARAETVDGVLYVVGARIVTRSDVTLEDALAPFDRSPVPALVDPARPTAERLVDIAVLRERAGDTDIYAPTAADVRARLERVRASVGAAAWTGFLRAWGLDEERLQGLLYSRMVVERYVLRNFGVSDADPAAFEAWLRAQRTDGLRVLAVRP
jgi:hypothetical protein